MKRIVLLALGLVVLGSQERAPATFAGGCFRCREPPYDKLEGDISTTSGYAGGTVPNPTYQQVLSGDTGHLEVMQVVYDPTDGGGQFCDRGEQYTTAIFYHNEEQRRLAEESLEEVRESTDFSMPIVPDIRPLETFYPAEDYHQDYYRKNGLQYRFYRTACGRDARLYQLWGSETEKIDLSLGG